MSAFILQDDRLCTLACKHCGAKLELNWRVWTDPEKKYSALQSFRQTHQPCQDKDQQNQQRENKLRFWSRPAPRGSSSPQS